MMRNFLRSKIENSKRDGQLQRESRRDRSSGQTFSMEFDFVVAEMKFEQGVNKSASMFTQDAKRHRV